MSSSLASRTDMLMEGGLDKSGVTGFLYLSDPVIQIKKLALPVSLWSYLELYCGYIEQYDVIIVVTKECMHIV